LSNSNVETFGQQGSALRTPLKSLQHFQAFQLMEKGLRHWPFLKNQLFPSWPFSFKL